jgi:hypothetical protein
VIDADFYRDLFALVIAVSREGRVLSFRSAPYAGVRNSFFTGETVARFVQNEPMQAAGAVLLWSAWEHMALLFE